MGYYDNTSSVAGTYTRVSPVLHGRISQGLNIDYGHFSCTNPGQDLSGSLGGAGGIGGLLSWQTGTNCYFYVADANGNVTELVNSRNPTNVLARYSYDPYGNILSSSGTLATSNTWRYSSKYFDVETGLGNWGYRYYDPVTGRWRGRDRIQEQGGVNLYGYVRNDGVGKVDSLGLKVFILRRNLKILPPDMVSKIRRSETAATILTGIAGHGIIGSLIGDTSIGLDSTVDYYVNNTWHCILVVAPKCEAIKDSTGHVIGFSGVKADSTWDFNDELINYPAADFGNPSAVSFTKLFQRYSVDTVTEDDTHDAAVKEFAAKLFQNQLTMQQLPSISGDEKVIGPTPTPYKMIRNNCCDWVTGVLGGAGLNYNNPNPKPFGPKDVPPNVYPNLIKNILGMAGQKLGQ